LSRRTIEHSPTIAMSATEELDKKLLIEEAKVACMTGLLICLAREQRLIYIIGDLFEIDHTLAGEIFNISPANFRQKLTRARKDLYQWMNTRCGLVNQANTQPLELFVFVDDTQPATDTAKVRIAHVAPCAQALHADDRALMNYLLRR
jgi:hypothetical protein